MSYEREDSVRRKCFFAFFFFNLIYLVVRPPHERVKGYPIQSTGSSSQLGNGSLFPPFFEANAALGEQAIQTSPGS